MFVLFATFLFPLIIMWKLGAGRAISIYVMSLIAIVIWAVAFIMATLLTLVIYADGTLRQWEDIPDGLTNALSGSFYVSEHFWALFLLPFTFVVDIIIWSFYVIIFHGNLVIWGIMGYTAIHIFNFVSAELEAILR